MFLSKILWIAIIITNAEYKHEIVAQLKLGFG